MNIIGANGKQKIYKGTVVNERPDRPIVDYMSNNNNRWVG